MFNPYQRKTTKPVDTVFIKRHRDPDSQEAIEQSHIRQPDRACVEPANDYDISSPFWTINGERI